MINENIKNPYLIEYCRIKGIKQGGEIKMVDYTSWIIEIQDYYNKKMFGTTEFFIYNASKAEQEKYIADFMSFLKTIPPEKEK